jgi:hypothetical protein
MHLLDNTKCASYQLNYVLVDINDNRLQTLEMQDLAAISLEVYEPIYQNGQGVPIVLPCLGYQNRRGQVARQFSYHTLGAKLSVSISYKYPIYRRF